jgi:hypothetical protein
MRLRVTLAISISKERTEHTNLDYLDPATVEIEEWGGREDEGFLVAPRAGEMLYRVR